jgi:hypothetical protein
MNNYVDLEISILSCLLQKPKLMENTILEDKYFIKHKKIWSFMKAFYKKFGNFDLTLMMSISKNKNITIEYICWLIEQEPAPSLFKEYEKQLIDLYNETKKEKWIIEKIYDLSNELYVRNIKVDEFQNKIKEIYENAEKIFEEVKHD